MLIFSYFVSAGSRFFKAQFHTLYSYSIIPSTEKTILPLNFHSAFGMYVLFNLTSIIRVKGTMHLCGLRIILELWMFSCYGKNEQLIFNHLQQPH